MKKLLPWLSFGVRCLFAIGIAPGCGSDEIGGATGGSATTTTGGSGNSLGGAGSKSGGAANTGGTSAAQGNINVMLGARCANDAACGTGLKCLTSDSGAISGGGPAGGICTADCTADPSVCQKLSANGRCVSDGPSAFCYEACFSGTPAQTEVKCHNRAEMACSAILNDMNMVVAEICAPQCNGAMGECRPGTMCDFGPAAFSAGLCRATPPAGLATGAKCDPKAATDPCRGFCYPFSDTVGACSDGCTVGSESCNPGGKAALEGICLPLFKGDDVGDAGGCFKFCDCSADCMHPDMKCLGFADTALESATGRKGQCAVPTVNDTSPIIETCGAGGAGGVPSTGGATGTGGATSTGGAPSAGGAPSGGGGGGGAGPT